MTRRQLAGAAIVALLLALLVAAEWAMLPASLLAAPAETVHYRARYIEDTRRRAQLEDAQGGLRELRCSAWRLLCERLRTGGPQRVEARVVRTGLLGQASIVQASVSGQEVASAHEREAAWQASRWMHLAIAAAFFLAAAAFGLGWRQAVRGVRASAPA